MLFAHDTTFALAMAADLVNTEHDGVDALQHPDGLTAFLDEHPMTGTQTGSARELGAVRQLRDRLRPVWHRPGVADTVPVVNDLLREADARPRLARHDGWDWHLHVSDPGQPLADRMGAEIAMALVDLVRNDQLDRLGVCAASDCDGVLVDLTRNRSKRFCDIGNCANREHVAAYRARRHAG